MLINTGPLSRHFYFTTETNTASHFPKFARLGVSIHHPSFLFESFNNVQLIFLFPSLGPNHPTFQNVVPEVSVIQPGSSATRYGALESSTYVNEAMEE